LRDVLVGANPDFAEMIQPGDEIQIYLPTYLPSGGFDERRTVKEVRSRECLEGITGKVSLVFTTNGRIVHASAKAQAYFLQRGEGELVGRDLEAVGLEGLKKVFSLDFSLTDNNRTITTTMPSMSSSSKAIVNVEASCNRLSVVGSSQWEPLVRSHEGPHVFSAHLSSAETIQMGQSIPGGGFEVEVLMSDLFTIDVTSAARFKIHTYDLFAPPRPGVRRSGNYAVPTVTAVLDRCPKTEILVEKLSEIQQGFEGSRSPEGSSVNLQFRRWLDSIHTGLFHVLQWVLMSNRGHLRHLSDAKDRVKGLPYDGCEQFVLLCGNPEQELLFRRAKERIRREDEAVAAQMPGLIESWLPHQSPTIYAFHGSGINHWNSILHNGLQYNFTAHGRAYGHGVYFATDMMTSVGYIQQNSSTPQAWPGSSFGAGLKCMALCEVINRPTDFTSSPAAVKSDTNPEFLRQGPYYVVQHAGDPAKSGYNLNYPGTRGSPYIGENWITTRYLIVLPETPPGREVVRHMRQSGAAGSAGTGAVNALTIPELDMHVSLDDDGSGDGKMCTKHLHRQLSDDVGSFKRPLFSAGPISVDNVARLAHLRDEILSPRSGEIRGKAHQKTCAAGSAPPSYKPVNVIRMFESVPGVEKLKYRDGTESVVRYIAETACAGLPMYAAVPELKEHTKSCMRYILHRSQSMENTRDRNQILHRLADAFTGCQAGQARVIDLIYGRLSGREKTFFDQVSSMIDAQLDRTLETITHRRNPGANDSHRLPHIQSRYMADTGRSVGMRPAVVQSGLQDPHAQHGDAAPLAPAVKEAIEMEFREAFDVVELAESLAADINLAPGSSMTGERYVEPLVLFEWAKPENSKQNKGFPSHSIFYDDDNPEPYRGAKPQDGNQGMPFVHAVVVLDILERLFCWSDS